MSVTIPLCGSKLMSVWHSLLLLHNKLTQSLNQYTLIISESLQVRNLSTAFPVLILQTLSQTTVKVSAGSSCLRVLRESISHPLGLLAESRPLWAVGPRFSVSCWLFLQFHAPWASSTWQLASSKPVKAC